MGTEKKQNNQKKVLDTLKEHLQPITDAEGNSLVGGFASAAVEESLDDIDANIACGGNKSGCNSSSCGTTKDKPAES